MWFHFFSAEDAQNHANSEQSDAILYIGGPPNPNQKCRNNDQFGHIINNFQTNSTELALSDEESDFQEADCDCRQWAFQFLRPIIRKPTPSSPTSDIIDPLLEDTTTDNDIDNKQLMYFGVLRNCGNCAHFVYISAAFSTG